MADKPIFFLEQKAIAGDKRAVVRIISHLHVLMDAAHFVINRRHEMGDLSITELAKLEDALIRVESNLD